MANEVSHHRKTPWFDHAMNGVPYVADPVASNNRTDALFQGLACRFNQRLGFVADCSDRNAPGGVAVVTLKDHPEIQLDQIALLQLSLLGGDAVDHFVVDGGAKAARKAQIALERGLGA